MEYQVLDWPPDGPKLRLDHERFAYAGKFVMTKTGKAVARDGDDLVAAVAFDVDRTDESTLVLRYVTVARDRRGEGIGPALVTTIRDRALERGFERVRIAVNNPYAYEALHRAGFGFTGETTGLAELVCVCPPPEGAAGRFPDGLDHFDERDLTGAERAFVQTCRERGMPESRDVATLSLGGDSRSTVDD